MRLTALPTLCGRCGKHPPACRVPLSSGKYAVKGPAGETPALHGRRFVQISVSSSSRKAIHGGTVPPPSTAAFRRAERSPIGAGLPLVRAFRCVSGAHEARPYNTKDPFLERKWREAPGVSVWPFGWPLRAHVPLALPRIHHRAVHVVQPALDRTGGTVRLHARRKKSALHEVKLVVPLVLAW